MRQDKLKVAQQIVRSAFVFFILSIAAILLAAGAGPRQHRTALFVHALNLTNLALAPPGTPLRNPQMLNAAVDLRFTPWLYPGAPQPIGLLLRVPPKRPSGAGNP